MDISSAIDVTPRVAMKYLLKGYPVLRYDEFTDKITDILRWDESLGIVRVENREVEATGFVPTNLILPHTKLRVLIIN